MRPETREAYGPDWAEVSRRIRFERAGGRCECDGRCGASVCAPRCVNVHGQPSPWTGKIVVLTTAHLGQDPTDSREENLLAMCAPCHLRYDSRQHVETRRARRDQPDAPLLW